MADDKDSEMQDNNGNAGGGIADGVINVLRVDFPAHKGRSGTLLLPRILLLIQVVLLLGFRNQLIRCHRSPSGKRHSSAQSRVVIVNCSRRAAAADAIWSGGPFGHTATVRVRTERRPFLLQLRGVRGADREFPAAEALAPEAIAEKRHATWLVAARKSAHNLSLLRGSLVGGLLPP